MERLHDFGDALDFFLPRFRYQSALARVPSRCGPWQRVWPPYHSLLCATLRQVCQWNRHCTIFEADCFLQFVSESASFKPVKIHQMSSANFRRVTVPQEAIGYRWMVMNDVWRDSTWHSESKMYRDVYVPPDVTVWLLLWPPFYMVINERFVGLSSLLITMSQWMWKGCHLSGLCTILHYHHHGFSKGTICRIQWGCVLPVICGEDLNGLLLQLCHLMKAMFRCYKEVIPILEHVPSTKPAASSRV